jgi:ATP-grasp domain
VEFNDRRQRIGQIASALGNRKLIWFGTRGEDGWALHDLPQFAGAFSIIDRIESSTLEVSESLEHLTGRRVDLDVWEVDNHLHDGATKQLRALMSSEMSRDHCVLTYRPSHFLSALTFAHESTSTYFGPFSAHQRAFEYKPWVETNVRAIGIPTLDWVYIADPKSRALVPLLERGPIVLRPASGSGGSGMKLVDSLECLRAVWPLTDHYYASISAFRKEALPLNVGAVVWDDQVTVYHPSVQLIGIPGCVGSRTFAYCGNDFALPASLEPQVLDQTESICRSLGTWLRSFGYRGAFGVDLLLDHGRVLFTELNARFQGSTRMSCQLSAAADESCIMLDHIAAFLHLEPPRRLRRLRDLGAHVQPWSQMVLHNRELQPVRPDLTSIRKRLLAVFPAARSEVDCESEAMCDRGAILTTLSIPRSITDTGYSLHADVEAATVHG